MTTVAPIHGEVSRNLKAVLAVWDLDQSDLAAWLGISSAAVSRLLSGQRPWALNYLDTIAEVIGVPFPLLTGSVADLLAALPPKSSRDLCSYIRLKATDTDIFAGAAA